MCATFARFGNPDAFSVSKAKLRGGSFPHFCLLRRGAMERTVFVRPSTGGQIEVRIGAEEGVDRLKAHVADRLGLHRDKIVLLHRNRQLTSGSLEENDVPDGSRLLLLPNVETGITTQNPEQCVLQALETLDASQVEDFLAGRLPLNLTMRLGDHMMIVQLQLSPQLPPTPPTSPPPPPEPRRSTPSAAQVLSEASRTLTRTLRQLSSAAMANKMEENCDGRCCVARREGGAVIESMLHHGRGVFSGTFSGTLSPGLQDEEGRPRRDICTVVHILNDLLGASSHCKPCSSSSPQQKKEKLETPPPSGNAGGVGDDVLRAKVDRLRILLRQRRRPYGRREYGPAVA